MINASSCIVLMLCVLYYSVRNIILFSPRASHGTRYMTDEEIVEAYGKERRWPYFEELIQNVNNIGGNDNESEHTGNSV